MNKVGTRKEDDVEGEAQRGTSFAGRVEMGSSVRKAANQVSNPNKQRKTRRKEGKWKMESFFPVLAQLTCPKIRGPSARSSSQRMSPHPRLSRACQYTQALGCSWCRSRWRFAASDSPDASPSPYSLCHSHCRRARRCRRHHNHSHDDEDDEDEEYDDGRSWRPSLSKALAR